MIQGDVKIFYKLKRLWSFPWPFFIRYGINMGKKGNKFIAGVFLLLLLSCAAGNVKVENQSINSSVKSGSESAGASGLQLLDNLTEHYLYIFSVDFSSDGKFLASGSADKNVIIWDCRTWQPLKIIKENYYELWGIPVKFTHDSKYLAIGSYETLKLASVNNNFEIIANTIAHNKGIQSLDISHDNRYIITAGVDSDLKVWSIPDLKPVSAVKAHENEVWSTCISSDDRYAVSGGEDGYLKIWKFPGLTLENAVKFHKFPIEYVNISATSKYILCADADSTISVWKWGEFDTPYRILKGHNGSVLTALFSKDERFVISGGQDDYIMIYDIEKGSMIYSVKEHRGDIMTLGLSQDGNFLASGSRDRTIKIWKITQ